MLLEKLLNKADTSGEAEKLVGLRTVRLLRSKASLERYDIGANIHTKEAQ